MRKILQLIILLGLFGSCRRTTDQVENNDSIDTLELSPQDDYAASTIYRSLDSDSLVMEKDSVDSLVWSFINQGQQIRKHEYEGGDCEGVYRTFKIKDNSLVLTIDKYDCGDYGFGNSQYLTKNDSILLTREFKVEWYNRTVYTVTERIIKFDNGNTTLKERETSTSPLGDLRFRDQPFKESNISSDREYSRINKELIDKGRVEQ